MPQKNFQPKNRTHVRPKTSTCQSYTTTEIITISLQHDSRGKCCAIDETIISIFVFRMATTTIILDTTNTIAKRMASIHFDCSFSPVPHDDFMFVLFCCFSICDLRKCELFLKIFGWDSFWNKNNVTPSRSTGFGDKL